MCGRRPPRPRPAFLCVQAKECENVTRVVKELAEGRSKTVAARAAMQVRAQPGGQAHAQAAGPAARAPAHAHPRIHTLSHAHTQPLTRALSRTRTCVRTPSSHARPHASHALLSCLPFPAQDKYGELQCEYARTLRVADLSRAASKENVARTGRALRTMRQSQAELAAARKHAAAMAERARKARVENGMLKASPRGHAVLCCAALPVQGAFCWAAGTPQPRPLEHPPGGERGWRAAPRAWPSLTRAHPRACRRSWLCWSAWVWRRCRKARS